MLDVDKQKLIQGLMDRVEEHKNENVVTTELKLLISDIIAGDYDIQVWK